MSNTRFQDVFDSFESSFCDKREIPLELEKVWLRKAISRYSVELDPLEYDEEGEVFNEQLNGYVIDTLAAFMKQYLQEREVSKVNKRISIVGKDLSINAGGHQTTAARNELEYDAAKSEVMIFNQMPSAYV